MKRIAATPPNCHPDASTDLAWHASGLFRRVFS